MGVVTGVKEREVKAFSKAGLRTNLSKWSFTRAEYFLATTALGAFPGLKPLTLLWLVSLLISRLYSAAYSSTGISMVIVLSVGLLTSTVVCILAPRTGGALQFDDVAREKRGSLAGFKKAATN
jgi:hypothetical protein